MREDAGPRQVLVHHAAAYDGGGAESGAGGRVVVKVGGGKTLLPVHERADAPGEVEEEGCSCAVVWREVV